MLSENKIIIGTRSSRLALWQAEYVKSMLLGSVRGIEVELKIITTSGDKIIDKPLPEIGGKGLFTAELEEELLAHTIDFAVHSLKDLPTELPDGLTLAAVPSRAYPNDALVTKKPDITIDNLPKGATVATGSTRRKAQLLHLRPDLNITGLRGNVPTRLQKLHDSDWDAAIFAMAGLERLNITHENISMIPFSQMLPAAGQGALGIEIASDNIAASAAAEKLIHMPTLLAVRAERAFLKSLGGGCQTPIGAFCEIKNNTLILDGLVCSSDGKEYFRESMTGAVSNPEALGESLAQHLLDIGANAIINSMNQ